MSSSKIAFITLVIASMFWSTSGVVSKILLKTFDPVSVGVIRLTLASIVILPFFLKATPKLSKKLFFDTLPVALFSMGNFLLFFFGIRTTTANASAIIYTVTPITVALLSGKLIGEITSRQKITGILIGLTGVLIILLLPIFQQGQVMIGDINGNLLIFIATVMFSFYNVGARYLISKKSYHPLTITGMSIFISALCFILIRLFLPHQPIFPTIFSQSNFLIGLYFAVFVTVVPYVFHQWVIKHSSATTGALTNYIQPVFAFIVNGIILGEIITGGFFVGTVLVFAGTFLATGEGIAKMMKREK